MDRREMLAEYFALTISDSGLVESLPLLLRDYIPNLDNLPSFLMRLGPQVSIYLSARVCCLPHLCERLIGHPRQSVSIRFCASLHISIPQSNLPPNKVLRKRRKISVRLNDGKFNTSFSLRCVGI
jgi:hypothetical protein